MLFVWSCLPFEVATAIIGKASGMGEGAIRHSAKTYRASRSFILREKVQLYNVLRIGGALQRVAVMSRLVRACRVTVRGTQFDLNNIGVGDHIVVEQVSTHPVR